METELTILLSVLPSTGQQCEQQRRLFYSFLLFLLWKKDTGKLFPSILYSFKMVKNALSHRHWNKYLTFCRSGPSALLHKWYSRSKQIINKTTQRCSEELEQFMLIWSSCTKNKTNMEKKKTLVLAFGNSHPVLNAHKHNYVYNS